MKNVVIVYSTKNGMMSEKRVRELAAEQNMEIVQTHGDTHAVRNATKKENVEIGKRGYDV